MRLSRLQADAPALARAQHVRVSYLLHAVLRQLDRAGHRPSQFYYLFRVLNLLFNGPVVRALLNAVLLGDDGRLLNRVEVAPVRHQARVDLYFALDDRVRVKEDDEIGLEAPDELLASDWPPYVVDNDLKVGQRLECSYLGSRLAAQIARRVAMEFFNVQYLKIFNI